MDIARGQAEAGIIIGNAYDKYGSTNPIVRWIMDGFDASLTLLVNKSNPRFIHEVGCGEGYWVVKWCKAGRDVRGSDFSIDVISMARSHASQSSIDPERFRVCSIYDVVPEHDSADLVVCCEVLEHLEYPELALEALQGIVQRDLIISVPREPLWRILNVSRGRYIRHLGNTPGHIQHWSQRGIVDLVSRYFDVCEVLSPLPWTMVHCKPR